MMHVTKVRELFDYDPTTGALTWRINTAEEAHAAYKAAAVEEFGGFAR